MESIEMAKSKKKQKVIELQSRNRNLNGQIEALKSVVPHTPRYIPLAPEQGYRKGRTIGSRWNGLSFALLREIENRSLLTKAIHSARRHQVLFFAKPWTGKKGETGFEIVHKDENNPEIDTKKIENLKERKAKILELFECPHPVNEPTFSGFCTKLVSDLLTINRPAVELIRDDSGQVIHFGAIDGAIILPTLRFLHQFQRSNSAFGSNRFQLDVAIQDFYRREKIDLSGAEWVIVRNGTVEGAVPPGEILVTPIENTTNIDQVGFPPSYLEEAIIGVISFCNAFSYNTSYFDRGQMAEIILGISGDFDDDSFLAFQDQMREGHTGVDGAWKVPVIRLDSQDQIRVVDLKKSNRDMEFKEFLGSVIELTTAVYRMHPSNINWSAAPGERPMFDQGKLTEIETAEEEGLYTLLFQIELICNRIIKANDLDLRFRWVGLTKDEAISEEELRGREISTWKTVDEIRIELGKKPFNQPWSKIPANPTVFGAAMQAFEQRSQEEEHGQEQEDFGQEPRYPKRQNNSEFELPQKQQMPQTIKKAMQTAGQTLRQAVKQEKTTKNHLDNDDLVVLYLED